jgi:hypothetical protein
MPHPDEQQRQRQLSVHMPPPHPHAQGFTPSDSQHFIPPPHALPPTGMPPDQMRYGDQPYGPMRPVYPTQMYYDPSMAPADYSVDPAHAGPPHGAPVYPSITTRTSPVNAYSPQASIPAPFHPTTSPVPQGAWTGGAPYYGSFGGIPPPGAQGVQPPLTDEMGHRQSVPSLYLSHAPTSAWSSPVLSSPYPYYNPYQGASPQMDRGENVGSPVLAEPWAPSPAGVRPPGRPPFVPAPPPQAPHSGAASGVAWSNLSPNPASLDSQRPSVSTAAEDPTKSSHPRPPQSSQAQAQSAHDKERKEYHPQPPARRSEWVMWVGNV